jgi:predicted nucleic acid-binding protein
VEFLDTNVLVYAASGIPDDRPKSAIARQLVARSNLAISLQVLQEFYSVARQPRKLDFTHAEAMGYCNQWRKLNVLEPTLALFDNAVALCARYQISYYDAAIIAAAGLLGCDVIYSEDLGHGQRYNGIRVENPFQNT